MNELMQPIHPAYAALLSGKRPEPCEPFVEVSSKALARLLDVVEFGDQLERVEKDNLLASMKELLAQEQPELWVIHSVGPGELHPMISKETADSQAAELAEMFKENVGKLGLRFDVIRSPFTPLEHFEILAEELTDHRDNLLGHCNALEKKLAEKPAIVLPMPVMPEQPEDAIDDSWMDGYNAALRMREQCLRAIEAAGMQVAETNKAGMHTLDAICDLFMIGKNARTHACVMANIENTRKFANLLHAIESEFFMVPGEIDPDFPDDQPYECLVNCWGSNQQQYVEQFRAALPAVAQQHLIAAARDVLAERQRQITAEGWTPDHDAEHDGGELAAAGAAYALHAADHLHPYSQGDGGDEAPDCWPWHNEVAGRGEGPVRTEPAWWKPGAPRRNLIKAGALILAEIERLDRAEQAKQQEQQP